MYLEKRRRITSKPKSSIFGTYASSVFGESELEGDPHSAVDRAAIRADDLGLHVRIIMVQQHIGIISTTIFVNVIIPATTAHWHYLKVSPTTKGQDQIFLSGNIKRNILTSPFIFTAK